ncbi:MAG: hypothetical protein OXN17_01350 [Candidatus Poribacteria bacterium]|nr:hypothetical protein [Candidatus Poribacteria bacterium]MDE0504420.1 hypothetical protein [Candidatus Poribacteria bacterium]
MIANCAAPGAIAFCCSADIEVSVCHLHAAPQPGLEGSTGGS